MSTVWPDSRLAAQESWGLDPWPPRTIGPYDVGGVIARGRRSVVYRASRGATDLALKVSTTVDFEDERWLLAHVAGPNVIEVHEHGYSPHGFWLALELASGGSLQAGASDDATTRRRLADCARGLAHVHRLGWVHRDLKPANLLLRADGAVVLADFGSACPIGIAAKAGQVVGTPLYASPELCEGAPAAPAADVYALGALLHEWLTGVPPFTGETPAEQAAQHLMAPIPRLPASVAHWQPVLDAMLAKDRTARLPDGRAVLDRIRP